MSKPNLIMVIDDNLDILDNIVLVLELNEFNVISANNGENAIEKLRDLLSEGTKPDLIISDIMMPVMDGYQLFRELSTNPEWNRIPFIFLTALASPDDVRFGKMLGVDDYITKPFNEEDLLATVIGKLAKLNKTRELSSKINEVIEKLMYDKSKNATECYLLHSVWDEVKGPVLNETFPQTDKIPFDANKTVLQLFQTAVSIYGFSNIGSPEGLLLDIKNIEQSGYIYFDAYDDDSVRGNKRQFMLAVIAENINYVESLKINSILNDYAKKLKKSQPINIEHYYQELLKVFKNPFV